MYVEYLRNRVNFKIKYDILTLEIKKMGGYICLI